jgi:hypothetical protein
MSRLPQSTCEPPFDSAGAEFELKELARAIDGYVATFQMGMVTHVEAGIDESIVEDAPPPRSPSTRLSARCRRYSRR